MQCQYCLHKGIKQFQMFVQSSSVKWRPNSQKHILVCAIIPKHFDSLHYFKYQNCNLNWKYFNVHLRGTKIYYRVNFFAASVNVTYRIKAPNNEVSSLRVLIPFVLITNRYKIEFSFFGSNKPATYLNYWLVDTKPLNKDFSLLKISHQIIACLTLKLLLLKTHLLGIHYGLPLTINILGEQQITNHLNWVPKLPLEICL